MSYITILGAGSAVFACRKLAGLNRTHMTVHNLMCDALLNREKEAARYALMLDCWKQNTLSVSESLELDLSKNV
jgi:alpha-galactosidase/6-phospho-beta-glucosidase family protein